jgi:hypothetical protein
MQTKVNEQIVAKAIVRRLGRFDEALFKVGDIVVAVGDITAGFMSTSLVVKDGTKLVVCGPSGNGLHPICVCKWDDVNYKFAVSSSDIRHV